MQAFYVKVYFSLNYPGDSPSSVLIYTGIVLSYNCLNKSTNFLLDYKQVSSLLL